jgi:AAA ATPase domain
MELLERQAFLESLEGFLASARGGRGRLVLVGGEAGIGKTSLVRAFLDLLDSTGTPAMVVVTSRDDEAGPGHPLRTVVGDPFFVTEVPGGGQGRAPRGGGLRFRPSWRGWRWSRPSPRVELHRRILAHHTLVAGDEPASPPLPGATYGSFGAACHYKDGTFVAAAAEDQCARRSPQTGARFKFRHPDLVALHVWLWYHNPDGLYSGTNPLVRPFNKG